MRHDSRQYDNPDPITGIIYEEQLSAMKEILDLGQFKIGDKNSKEYLYFKSKVMDSVYGALQKTYDKMLDEGCVERCPSCQGERGLRSGWCSCPCRGSGYVSIEE